MNRAVAIAGLYQVDHWDAAIGASLEELIFHAVKGALADAEMDLAEVRSVVLASSDGADGRVISSMVTSGPAGGYGRDIVNVSSSGDHALLLAYMRILSGIYDSSLVVSWGKSGEGPVDEEERLACDPIYTRAVGLNGAIALGFQATAYLRHHPKAEEAAAAVAVRSRRNGSRNPHAHLRDTITLEDVLNSPLVTWPLRTAHLPPHSDAVAAMVLVGSDRTRTLKKEPLAWIKGAGWASDTYWLGERELSAPPSLQVAARRAYKMAGIQDIRSQIDVAEIHDLSAFWELSVYGALGLCRDGEVAALVGAGATELGGELPVNPSGGALAANPTFATGLVRIAEAAVQVAGRAGDHQVPGVKTALAHASHGFAGQGNTVVILSNGP